MTRTMIALVSTVALVLASSGMLAAQGKSGSTPKAQHVSKGTTTKVSSPKTTNAAPKTAGPKTTTVSQTSKGPKTTTVKATGKTKTTSSPATRAAKADAKTTTRVAKADTKATKRDGTRGTSTASTATAPTTTTTGDTDTPPVPLTRVQERLQKNTKLAERLEGRLPRGTDLMEAAEGFRNLGQFVAAVNVSSNLGLDFEKVRVAMVEDGKSLGQAIQVVKTDVENPTLIAQRAESEAQTLIQQTEKATTATTTTTTSTATQKTKPKDKPKTTRSGSGS